MRPTETLMAEHRGIEKMLRVTENAAERLSRGEPVDVSIFEKAVDFFRNFADRCHHGKEEKQLFQRLVAHGMDREKGPVGVMLKEHELGRGHIRGMSEAIKRLREGEPQAGQDLIRHALAYAELLTAHIRKEDQILFPLADRTLLPEEQAELGEAFERVEAEEMGEGVHERYHQMIHELLKEVQVAR